MDFIHTQIKNVMTCRLPSVIRFLAKRNVMVVKLLQSLAGLENMSDEVNDVIRLNVDHVLYSDDEIDYKQLLNITNKYKITLDSLTPINAGMIAIVFSGIDRDGKRVVVKMKRKNIKPRLITSYGQFKSVHNVLFYFMNYFFAETFANFDSFIRTEEFMLTQCEFESEIKAMVYTRNNISQYGDDIVIPMCYNDEHDRRINTDFIVMEFIDGKSCFDVEDKHKIKLVELLVTYMGITGLLIDVGHADLHPGNIIVTSHNDTVKLGIIDFGMNMNTSDPLLREFTIACMNASTSSEPVDVLKSFSKFTIPQLDTSRLTFDEYAGLNSKFELFVHNMSEGILCENDVRLITDEIRPFSKHKQIVISQLFVRYVMSASMLQSTIRLLVQDKQVLAAAYKRATKVIMSY